ncbi:hypothetical protein SAMN02745181_0836 [Rubritalea squalenifaciens DSM 18772]|uniref:Uncharacterized protein n=1 Tax=Rubritalea squalenifaciens DSM 18772 TaxID=1123071 RepID=A0A1M6DUC6_9BACT|nr:hypothetical protein [Rubritalea squalenifaciens]SHI76854.1 hypothetical protein SAMN02745181_0836 [Rubritalea squalenifaciens DSM 18772]
MKTPFYLCLIAAVTISTQADAQRKRGPHHRGKAVAKAAAADHAELGALKDKFLAFRTAVYEGNDYYTDKDIDLRAAHRGLYLLICDSLIEDRIREDAGFFYNEQLFLIAEDAKKMRGNKDVLPEYQAKKIKAKLTKLRDDLKSEREDTVKPEILTPQLNRIQINLEELVKFGQDEDILSSGEASSIRRKMNNLSRDEKKAKSDKNVSDKEREKLMEEARELRRETIKQLLD